MPSSKEWLTTITGLLKTYDYKEAAQTCKELVAHLYASGDEFETGSAEKILQQLRSKRRFNLMQDVTNALIQTGRLTYKIRRQYAQALIDLNNLTAAIAILKELVTDTANAPKDNEDAKSENTEARGLSGRVYKQLYVNAQSPGTTHSIRFLKKAIKFYLDVYITDPAERTWHGINAVALLKRAIADNVELAGFPSADELAKEILQTIEKKHEDQQADAWDFATAAEACVALNRPVDALEWTSGYARMPYCDAFELASYLRQLEEVWKLDMSSGTGRLLLPICRAELMKRDGGNVLLSADDLQQQFRQDENLTATYKALAEKDDDKGQKTELEKVFGDESFQTYKWYMTGAARCQAVARIGKDHTRGHGTGFLLRGPDLCASISDELILLTNAHVVSNDPRERKALGHTEVIIIFEALNRDEEFRAAEIIWSSPSDELDATILRFRPEDMERLKALTGNIQLFPLSGLLPTTGPGRSPRVYIIGHPFGGTLQLSFQDNILLNHKDPKLHYRTPTVGGSSGSPVFNEQWQLIGLHHGAVRGLTNPDGKPGFYDANEGIWIEAIKRSICNQPTVV